MARFTRITPQPPVHAPWSIGANVQPIRTHQGGRGFAPSDPHVELFNAAVSGMLVDQFYESGDERINRLAALVPQCDPAWLRSFIPWLRSEAHLRSAPLVLAAEYVRAGFSGGRQLVAQTLQRADEPGELLAYWLAFTARRGSVVPKPIKRGIADAITRGLYNEYTAMRYDGSGNPWRFGDVIEVVHPDPQDETQAALLKFLLDRRRHDVHAYPGTLPRVAATQAFERIAQRDERNADALRRALDNGAVISWERAAAWYGKPLDAAMWEVLIPTMGYFALLRNFNNFSRARISQSTQFAVMQRLTDADEIAKSKVLPFRFFTAYKNLEDDVFKSALSTAADMAVSNLPEFKGKTLIMVDCSGSMHDPVGAGKSRKPLVKSELAGFFAESLARRCESAQIACYDTSVLSVHDPSRHVGVLRAATDAAYTPRGGTHTWTCTEAMWAKLAPVQRIIVITDEQISSGDIGDTGRIPCPVITWNVAGYQPHHAVHGSKNRFFVAGFNDTVMQTLPAVVLRGSTGKWPWEV